MAGVRNSGIVIWPAAGVRRDAVDNASFLGLRNETIYLQSKASMTIIEYST
jgi:hypothetical protein